MVTRWVLAACLCWLCRAVLCDGETEWGWKTHGMQPVGSCGLTVLEKLSIAGVFCGRAQAAENLPAVSSAPWKPVADRVADRSFPSAFMAWSPATNLEGETPLVTMARHDLIFVGPGRLGLRWNRQPVGLADSFKPASIPAARALRAHLQELNPNLILLAEIRYRDAHSGYLPENHAWWKRDQNGKRLAGWKEGGFLLLDLHNPQFREHVARQAKAAVQTGAFDGVMLDWWRDDADRLALVQAVRQQAGEDAIILVNANDRQTPKTAPYVNGYFMECWRSKTRKDWERIAETLLFAEKRLRQPHVNCVETWYEHSRQDLHRMRATTCLVLTHSDGYCLFSDPNGLPSPDHRHDWYPFWEKRLGKPVSAGAIDVDGSARRDFEHGTAVYNPPGNAPRTITFAKRRTSLATRRTARIHVVSPLDGDIFLHDGAPRQGR